MANDKKSYKKVLCWILSKDAKSGEERCLLLKTNEERGSFWQPVTGSVENGEESLEAARREVSEETGFTFKSPALDLSYQFEFESRFGHATERAFCFYLENCPTPQLDPKEHVDYCWTNPEESLRILKFDSNKEALRKAVQMVFKKDMPKL